MLTQSPYKTKKNLFHSKMCTKEEAMEKAIKCHDIDTVQKLLFDGADIHKKDSLTICSKEGDIPKTTVWHSLIHTAAWSGNGEIVKLLIRSGAGLNCQFNGDNTPLMNAVSGGNMDTFMALLDMGADVNIELNIGHKALCIAKLKGGDVGNKMRDILELSSSPCTKCTEEKERWKKIIEDSRSRKNKNKYQS